MDKKWPRALYGYAILLDNKLENWEVSFQNKQYVHQFSGYWKRNKINKYKLVKICWICRNNEEVNRVFDNIALKWFKTWKHADDYSLTRAY